MTQAKIKKSETSEYKKNDDLLAVEKKNLKSKYFNDKCIQIAAWMLLTLGLCIIITTFYLAINQKVESGIDDADGMKSDKTGDERDKDQHEHSVNVDILAKSMSKKIIEIGNITFQGCEEKLCKMVCMQAGQIFETLNHSMKLSDCNSLDALMIYDQHFERGILKNNWVDTGRTVQELAILDSQITTIKSDAFNTPMFSNVFLMYWRNLNLKIVQSGALLGLHSLKYLMIDSKITCLDRAFFQPVQTTILYLKIHAGLTVNKDESFFGISNLEKLEYADLSRNSFNGPISKKTFQSTPNLKYLLLARCKITAIKDDAFKHLAGKLALLDLSHNMLTTLSDKVLQPLLKGNTRSLINVAMNSFICDCNIRPLVKVYKLYRSQFMDALYCKAPHQLYGKFIDEIEFNNENCENDDTTMHNSADEEDYVTSTLEPTISKPITSTKETTTDVLTTDVDYGIDSDDLQKSVEMRCWHSPDSYESSESHSMEIISAENGVLKPLKLIDAQPSAFPEAAAVTYPIDSLRFAQPTHEFELTILKNHSVKVEIIDEMKNPVNIVWFAEDVEDFSKDVPCMVYSEPHIVTEPLIENKTYTFCLIPANSNGITPFNCLPLHVAPTIEPEDIWIAREQKQFTIGMLCLLFLMSTFAGAVIAYFGIRAYPDLLEGSKNVLVVKKSDKTCYVSTISEADYMKKGSLKKKPSSSSIQKSSLPETPTSLSSPSIMSTFELERLSSLKSSATFFEDPFKPLPFMDDEYEKPKPMEKEIIYANRSVPNTYVATSPTRSPPPLPKRNSTANITDYAF